MMDDVDMIKFKSKDDVIVYLSREDCERCETLRAMLATTFSNEGETDTIPLSTLSYQDMNMLKTWFVDAQLPTAMDDLRILMRIANFLEVKMLIDSICKKIAEMVAGKEPRKIKALFGVADSTYESDNILLPILELPPYDGTDFNLEIDRRECYRHADDLDEPPGSDVLLVCTGCRLMKYCSKNCQRKDWSFHKEYCISIQKGIKKMEKEKNQMFRIEGPNVIEEYMGHVWGNVDCRDYCRARMMLADSYLSMAHEEEHASMYEAGLKHYLELQRLIRSDNMGLRNKTPFILINLNRDDDAYNFVKFWLTLDEDFWCNPKPFIEGEWMYLTEQNRYEDPSVFMEGGYFGFCLPHEVALLIIKLRIIAKHAADVQVFNSVWELIEKDGRWQALMDMRDSLKKHIAGDMDHFSRMEDQRKHIDYLLNRIATSNSIFLKAVLDPAPLRSQPFPESYSRGSAEEAFLVLNDCCRIFHRLPGALKRIKTFVGSDTEYDPAFKPSYRW